MNARPLSRAGLRLRLVLVVALLGAATGGYAGMHWETRGDAPDVRQAFVHEFLPARVSQMSRHFLLRLELAPPWAPSAWLRQFESDPQYAYWFVRFEHRLRQLEVWSASCALLFVAVALRLTKRRVPGTDAGTATHHLRRSVRRPWN